MEIDESNLGAYLKQRGWLEAGQPFDIRLLTGGVSNVVLRVESPRGALVVKQSRARLRTKTDWFSSLTRIYREIDMLRSLTPLLPAGAVPQVIFEDRENFLFAMEAAPADHQVWKAELISGETDPEVAAVLGDYLAAIHRDTAGDARLKELLGDGTCFDELRIDPFYRCVAARQPDLRIPITRLIERMESSASCVVHADFSPKNVLVTRTRRNAASIAQTNAPATGDSRLAIVLVDFETGHYGDPAFDLGFFLSHLLLKAVLFSDRAEDYFALVDRFWQQYLLGLGQKTRAQPLPTEDLESRAVMHLGACMLARVDGKSPVDYLTRQAQQDLVRQFSRRILLEPRDKIGDVITELKRELH